MKKNTPFLLAGIIFIILVALGLKVIAQTPSQGQSTVIALPFPSPPYEEIVQFNNLKITQITSGNIFVALTSTEIPNPCLRFENESSSRSQVFPCPSPLGTSQSPIAHEASYNIHVSSKTILLLRTRAKATISDFEIGDRINVYGFYDTETNGVESLIVRNLSKPAERRFIQLNNAEVVTEPANTLLPLRIIVIQRLIQPCFDYGASGTSPAVRFLCPQGLKTFTAADKTITGSQLPADSLYPPTIARKYVIEITAQTTLLTRVRGTLMLDEITIGDKLNVYGLLKEDNATIEAITLRDLTKPLQTETLLGTIVSVDGDGSFTIRTDEGEEFKVRLSFAPGQRIEIKGLIERVTKIISDLQQIRKQR